MGSKKINKYHLIVDGEMSGTDTITSAAQNIENFDNVGLQVDWTDDAEGTISVLCSVDGDIYHELTFSPALAQPAGTDGGYVVDLNQVPFPLLKIQYVNDTGGGFLNVWIFSKDMN